MPIKIYFAPKKRIVPITAPSRKAINKTTKRPTFFGRAFPIASLNGIRPCFIPSIKNISPTITATRAAPIVKASLTGCLRINI